jgi:isoquinoline 1-oxidoreductase subunit beta
VDQRTTSAIGDDEITKTVKTLGLDIGEFSGVFSPYSGIPNYRVNMASVDVGIPTIVWRGVGLLPNSFAIESFMDELALLAKADPLQFRLDHLAKDQVGKNSARLLKEVAKRSGWGTPLGEGQGRGIGVATNAGTILSVVVQVTVADKAINVDKVWACVDPGLVINPAGAELQIAGGIMMGLSSAFGEQVSFKNGIATNTNFDSYAILRPNQAPPIDIHLMGSGDTPGGIGEPGVGPICGSLANAIFAATGQRLRTLPLQLG